MREFHPSHPNRGTIETFNEQKEKFLVFISLLSIPTFRGIRIIPRKRDYCDQIKRTFHVINICKIKLYLNRKIENWKYVVFWKTLISYLEHTNLRYTILYRSPTYKHLIVPPTPSPGLCVQHQSISMKHVVLSYYSVVGSVVFTLRK